MLTKTEISKPGISKTVISKLEISQKYLYLSKTESLTNSFIH